MQLLKNAVVMPLKGSMDSFAGGVFTADGQFMEDSLPHRGQPAEVQKAAAYLSGIYIYGGCLFGHYGHFIWESLARLYAVRNCKNYPIIFISPNDKVFNVQKMFCKSIIVQNEIIVVKYPTSVENLIYAQPGSSLHPVFIIDDQLIAMSCLQFSYDTNDRKIWLSRNKLKHGKITNEEYIENELKKFGYEIIHPETLPFKEQVRLISTSSIVAGCEGSQFFSFLFAKEIQGRFFIFNRRKRIPKPITYSLERKNVECSLHTFDLEYIDHDGASANFYHPHPEYVVNILKNA